MTTLTQKFGLGLSIKLTNLTDLNDLYDEYFDSRDFTDLEMKMFNTDEEVIVDLTDPDSVNSLTLYYIVIKDTVNFLKYTTILMKLGDTRGIFKLGRHFHEKKDYENAKKYYDMASAKGHVYAKFNLSLIYKIENNIAMTKQLLQECIGLDYEDAYVYMSAVLLIYDKNVREAMNILIEGIKKEYEECFEYFEKFFENSTGFYIELMRLPFINLMIQNKIREILPRVDLNEVEKCRGHEIVYVLPGTSKK